MSTVIDTRTAQRRTLRFASIIDLEAELKRLEEAHRQGRLRHTGNWSPGQILGHLAAWIEYGWKGYPEQVRAPWFVRLLSGLLRRRFLRTSLPPGFRIPRVEGGTVGTEPMEFEEGLARLRLALEPLKRGEAPPIPSPALGRCNSAEAIQLMLRHAELHLGYLRW